MTRATSNTAAAPRSQRLGYITSTVPARTGANKRGGDHPRRTYGHQATSGLPGPTAHLYVTLLVHLEALLADSLGDALGVADLPPADGHLFGHDRLLLDPNPLLL